MPLITGEIVFIIAIALVLFGLFLLGPFLLLMHFLMPKVILDKYFCEPYFKPLELVLFTGIPYAPMRTIMFMWVFVHPSLGKKRGLCDAYKMAPDWYRYLSLFYYIALFGSVAISMSIFIGIYVYGEFLL